VSTPNEEGVLLRRLRIPIVLLSLLAAAFVPGAARPAATAGIPLTGTVGQSDSFTISLKDANGVKVSQLDPGDYTITVHDLSSFHNFHLFGPGGVDQATDVDGTGDVTWNVTFVDGVYKFQCDAHPLQMKGSFNVGPPPPPPPKLKGKVGPGKTITLKDAGGAAVKSLAAGKYSLTVQDATKKDNFHLSGPGVSKKTSVKGKSKAKWTVTFRAGTYVYRSDAHKKLKRRFKVLGSG
jgi:plastocyanin